MGFISTSRRIIEELSRFDDTSVTVAVDEREYVIDSIGHSKRYGIDGEESHLCLNVRDVGGGCVIR